ncbi:PIN domain-containing protein [Ruegeria sp. 2205SS24-7]|uniref:RSP_2648 family PIN domain-containing protein n=1 Tax=Ruegeria discodermiae TaxID=3064389 RepID=UPI0027403BDA|nr:PIN domain-containing protein [Ruegeria sp. 2205SS24-7]MDP5216016.1 PIN domain-containing protein [Ruegeria sp. 2205SS24-7]
MRAVLDTCVIFPTIMREMLLGAAEQGHFEPQWSDRILEEWARAAARLGPEGEAQARAEAALMSAAWPKARVAQAPGIEARLWLPDPADIHVLATAIAGSADTIITLNAKDFPRNILSEEGLTRIDPDGLLYQFWLQDPTGIEAVGRTVLEKARGLSEGEWQMRPLLKKARLPRLAKALAGIT